MDLEKTTHCELIVLKAGIECNEKVHLFDLHSEFQTTLTYFFILQTLTSSGIGFFPKIPKIWLAC